MIYKQKAIVLIESPLQLLNSLEALGFFSIRKAKVIIRLNSNNNNNSQIKKVLYLLQGHDVTLIKISSEQKKINDYVKSLKICLNFIFFSFLDYKCFIGNYESKIFNLFKKFIPKKKIILLDDGTKTLAIQSKFTEKHFYSFFTCFDLKVKKNQTIFKNDYNLIRNLKFNNKKSIPLSCFLGSPLSEKNIMDEQAYINILKRYLEKYSLNRKLIYLPHRFENEIKLKRVSDLGYTVMRTKYPVELLPIMKNLNIKHVTSFYSTALILMPKIYNVRATSLKFNFKNAFNADDISDIYKYFDLCSFIDLLDV